MGTDQTTSFRETWLPSAVLVLFTTSVYLVLLLKSKR